MQSLELFQEWFDKGIWVYWDESDFMDLQQVIAWCLGFTVFCFLCFIFYHLKIFSFPVSLLLAVFFSCSPSGDLSHMEGCSGDGARCSLCELLAVESIGQGQMAVFPSKCGHRWGPMMLLVAESFLGFVFLLEFPLSLSSFAFVIFRCLGLFSFLIYSMFLKNMHPLLDHCYPVHLTSSGCAPLCSQSSEGMLLSV